MNAIFLQQQRSKLNNFIQNYLAVAFKQMVKNLAHNFFSNFAKNFSENFPKYTQHEADEYKKYGF